MLVPSPVDASLPAPGQVLPTLSAAHRRASWRTRLPSTLLAASPSQRDLRETVEHQANH